LENGFDINAIPYENYEYENVKDKCCENVIGYANKTTKNKLKKKKKKTRNR